MLVKGNLSVLSAPQLPKNYLCAAFPRSKHYLYEPDACRLRRLSSSQTLSCLEGSRVVFIGDSVMRYQYTSLVRFIAAGGYQVRTQPGCVFTNRYY